MAMIGGRFGQIIFIRKKLKDKLDFNEISRECYKCLGPVLLTSEVRSIKVYREGRGGSNKIHKMAKRQKNIHNTHGYPGDCRCLVVMVTMVGIILPVYDA